MGRFAIDTRARTAKGCKEVEYYDVDLRADKMCVTDAQGPDCPPGIEEGMNFIRIQDFKQSRIDVGMRREEKEDLRSKP